MDDLPIGFGYKMAWLAVRSRDLLAVGAALGFPPPSAQPSDLLPAVYPQAYPASWETGVDAVYNKHDLVGSDANSSAYLFITPPIGEWTLVVGWAAWADDPRETLSRLSAQFAEAQAFSTHRVTEAHYWMLARNGGIIRAFYYVGDIGELLTDVGALTPVEEGLGINVSGLADITPDSLPNDFYPPTEDDVMTIAAAWSVDPIKLDTNTPAPGPGILVRVR